MGDSKLSTGGSGHIEQRNEWLYCLSKRYIGYEALASIRKRIAVKSVSRRCYQP